MFDFNTFKTTATNRNFLNISSEEKRTYFKGLCKIKEIYYPIALSISKTGHYVLMPMELCTILKTKLLTV